VKRRTKVALVAGLVAGLVPAAVTVAGTGQARQELTALAGLDADAHRAAAAHLGADPAGPVPVAHAAAGDVGLAVTEFVSTAAAGPVRQVDWDITLTASPGVDAPTAAAALVDALTASGWHVTGVTVTGERVVVRVRTWA
jgi:hypothetical protein